jgi:hypothetical protein
MRAAAARRLELGMTTADADGVDADADDAGAARREGGEEEEEEGGGG